MNRQLLRHGFILILLALVSGLFIPAMAIPRLGLSAHTIGILSGVLLVAVGAAWSAFSLSVRTLKWLYFSWLYAGYANWAGVLVGGIWGAGKMTTVAAGGLTGPDVAEAVVALLLGSVALASFVAVTLSIRGLSGAAVQQYP